MSVDTERAERPDLEKAEPATDAPDDMTGGACSKAVVPAVSWKEARLLDVLFCFPAGPVLIEDLVSLVGKELDSNVENQLPLVKKHLTDLYAKGLVTLQDKGPDAEFGEWVVLFDATRSWLNMHHYARSRSEMDLYDSLRRQCRERTIESLVRATERWWMLKQQAHSLADELCEEGDEQAANEILGVIAGIFNGEPWMSFRS